jgi:hypothetical protein
MTPGESERIAGYVRGVVGKAEYQQRKEVMPPDTDERSERVSSGAATVPRSSDVAAGGEYRGDTFQSIQSGNVMDPATWERIPDPIFTTAPGTNTVDADPNFVPTREPCGAVWHLLQQDGRCPKCNGTWRIVRDGPFLTDAYHDTGEKAARSGPDTLDAVREAANVTRLPEDVWDGRSNRWGEDAIASVSRLIAERDSLKDQRERLAEYIEALEARIRILEE